MSSGGGNPVALVTGAAGGLGGAVVSALAEAGWRVAAAGHRTPPTPAGPEVWPCRLDVRDGAACEAIVGETLSRWGRLDLLVNNAGATADRLLAQMEDAAWDRVLDVNLKGAFLCARAALPGMIRRRRGHIVNVASFAGRTGARGQSNYAAAKAGLIGLTLSLAREVGPKGIRVNAIVPGVMRTGMTEGLPDAVWDAFGQASVLGGIQTAEEVARLVVALGASDGVSGQVLQWDGRIAAWA